MLIIRGLLILALPTAFKRWKFDFYNYYPFIIFMSKLFYLASSQHYFYRNSGVATLALWFAIYRAYDLQWAN